MAAAAKALNITQPALSYAITQLEKELGMSLFDRQNGKLKLNSYAFPLLETADTILQLLDDCSGQMRAEYRNSAERVYIGVCYSGVLSLALYSYIQNTPSVQLHETILFPDNACHALEIGAVNFMCTYDVLTSSKYIQIPLFQEHIMALVPKQSPLSQKNVLCLEDLQNIRTILKAPPKAMSSLLSLEVISASPEQGGLNLLYEGNDDLIALKLAENNMGVILLPDSEYRWTTHIMEGSPCSHALTPVPFDHKRYAKTMYLTWMKNSQMNDRSRDVLSYILDYYQQSSDAPDTQIDL